MKPYHIRLTFDIHIAPWRMDDPTDLNNHDWSLSVFDRNLGQWIPLSDCTRPGESHRITDVHIYDENEASGSTPEDSN